MRKKISGILRCLILICCTMLMSCRGGSYYGPPSDHFDGTHFFNPGDNTKRTVMDLIRWWFSAEKETWPEYVRDQHQAKIIHDISSDSIRVTFVNHDTMLLQAPTFTILTDPIWSDRASPFAWLGPRRVRDPGVAFSDLPHIDAVLVSHNHYDHLDIPTLKKLNDKFHPLFFVPLGNKKLLESNRIENVVELDWWQSYAVKDVIITLLPAKHWSSRWLHDKYKALWGSFGIKMNGMKIYFAGDTGFDHHFKTIKSEWGNPDLAFIPIGSYEPRWFMKPYHLMPIESVAAHIDLNARYSIGMHFGTFQLSNEAIDQPEIDLAFARLEQHVDEKKFFVLKEGQSFTLTRAK